MRRRVTRRSPAAVLLALALVVGVAAADDGADEGDVERWWDPLAGQHVGLFNPLPASGGTPTPDEAELLQSLGYLQGYEAPSARAGVLRHDARRAQPGYNLYVSGHETGAFLMTMDGKAVHRWRLAFSEACPPSPYGAMAGQRWWRRAHLLPDGSILAIFEYSGLVKVDRDSKLVWARCGLYHHDVTVDANGRILVLVGDPRRRADGRGLFGDRVEILAPDGTPQASIPLLEAFAASAQAALVAEPEHDDVFHTNTLRLLPRETGGKRALGGDVLLSMRNLHLLAALELGTGRLTWSLAGDWRAQHEPVLLGDGAILLFDNLGRDGRSRAIEVDAQSGAIRWSYPATQRGHDLFSPICGSVQRLANGNTLITESTAGRALEVTRDQRVVWEFVSPHRVTPDGDARPLVAMLGELTRIETPRISGWLSLDR